MPSPERPRPRRPEQQPEPEYLRRLRSYDRAYAAYSQEPTEQHLTGWLRSQAALNEALLLPGKVELGQTVATRGAIEAMREASHIPAEFLVRHKNGDWGDLDEEDKQENEVSLRRGYRLLSAYRTRQEERLWVITEWDRSVTTLLLPEEY